MHDNTTLNRRIPLPHADNFLHDDVERIREAFVRIDEILASDNANISSLQQISDEVKSNRPAALTVDYRPDGRVNRVVSTLHGGGKKQTVFTYDKKNNLKQTVITTPYWRRTIEYTYDEGGTLISYVATEVNL